MRLRSVIKTFKFENQYRSRITLGSDTRLHPIENRLMLQEDEDGYYPLTDDLEARTWVANPDGARQWLGFEARVQHGKDPITGEVKTAAKFRLSDGTDDYWWDGGAWDDAPTVGEWNTEEQIATNISTFPVADKKIQVIVNPSTQEKTLTPRIEWVKVLYSSDTDEYEDIIYRTLVRQMRENIRPIGRFIAAMPSTGSSFDLDDFVNFDTHNPYKVIDVDAVFNYTDDPDCGTDLLQSYDSGTHAVTLTGNVDADKRLLVRVVYEPLVAVQTSKVFEEINRVPAILLTSISTRDASRGRSEDDWVVNKDDGTAVKVPGPIKGSIEVTARLLSASGIDQGRLASETMRWFEDNPLITSPGFDDEYRLWLLDEYSSRPSPDWGDLHAGELLFRVVDVRLPGRSASDEYGVKRFLLTGDMNQTIE